MKCFASGEGIAPEYNVRTSCASGAYRSALQLAPRSYDPVRAVPLRRRIRLVQSIRVPTTQNGFATAAGGGLDYRLTQHIGLKPIQVEYVATQLPNV